MRADQWLMLGVGALGLYAVYRLTRASNVAAPKPPEARPYTNAPDPHLPTEPSPAAPPPGVLLLKGTPLALANGRAYRGRLETSAKTPPLTPTATAEELGALFEALGFDGVRIAMNPLDGALAGFPAWSLVGAGQGTRWIYGRWTPPTMQISRSPALSLLWVSNPMGRPDAPSKV